jgi:outer membrane lipoprotein SlyB
MNTIKTVNRIHPLMAIAAVSVIALSGVGIAAIMGVLPSSHGTTSPANNEPPSAVTSGPAGASPSTSNFPPPNTPPPASSTYSGVAPPAPITGQAGAPPNGAIPVCNACGRVEAIRTVEQQAKPSGVGAVAGAILGGVIGNRFGGGNGRALTTVGGAVGGGFAGNEIEKHTHTTTSYLIEVRMENGKLRTFHSATPPGWQIGEPVQVVQGKLTPRS